MTLDQQQHTHLLYHFYLNHGPCGDVFQVLNLCEVELGIPFP